MSRGAGAESADWDLAPAEAVGLWRTEIALRVRDLRRRLGLAKAAPDGARDRPPMTPAERVEHESATAVALDDATKAIRCCAHGWARLKQWASGEAITAAWESVHRAERELVEIGSDQDALEALPQLRWWMEQLLGDSKLLRSYQEEFDKAQKGTELDRSVLRRAYADATTANVEWHTSQRAFRNVLFGIAGALAVLLVGLGLWHALHPSMVSLCQSTTTGGMVNVVCFDGTEAPAGRAIFEVELIGAVGGLLGTSFLLGNNQHAPSRYNLLAPQIVLKGVGGAATALIGVLFVQSHVFVAPLGTDSTAGLLAYAAVFGFSQELLTRFVDQRAKTLLKPGGAND